VWDESKAAIYMLEVRSMKSSFGASWTSLATGFPEHWSGTPVSPTEICTVRSWKSEMRTVCSYLSDVSSTLQAVQLSEAQYRRI
jgi:hypothetical protein